MIIFITSFSDLKFFFLVIFMCDFFVSRIGMIVRLLTVSQYASQREIFLDDCLIAFSRRKTIGSYVLFFCALIDATLRCAIPLICSSLDPEETCTEAAPAWLLVVKFLGLMGVDFFYKSIPNDVSVGHASTENVL